ncbi:hypothetical protein, partial [Anaerofustis stercorihominis]|uniref:hypothetical protein n=1 Tax=Anaerofustis stercorihominis TaxID=214853 RepID=UPI00214AC593
MNKIALAIFVNKSNLKLANLANANPLVLLNVPRHIWIFIKIQPILQMGKQSKSPLKPRMLITRLDFLQNAARIL